MSNWIKNLINKVAGTDPEPQSTKPVKDNGWISDVMNINEDEISQEENDAQAEMEEVRGVKKAAGAYAEGDSEEDTIEKLYELRVKSLSNYNLMEMLLEYDLRDKGLATTVQAEAKDKMKKYVEGNRGAAEKKLLEHLGTHSKLDIEKAFEKFKKEQDAKHASEKDLFEPKPKTGDQNWEKKVDYSAPSDKEKLKAEKEHGVGHEEGKGQVGKEATTKEFTCDSCGKHLAISELSISRGNKNYCVDCKDKKEASQKEAEKKPCHECDGTGKVETMQKGETVKLPCPTCKKKEASDISDKIRKKVEKKINEVVEEVLGDTVITPKEDMVKEHENLVNVLETPTHKDDKPEAEKQKEELKEYKEAYKGEGHDICEVCGKEEAYKDELTNTMKCLDCKRTAKHAEIKSKVTKEAALSKIAEVESPWYVVEDEKGEKHIAKRKKETNKKESGEEKPNVR
jgi:hypothetical protein